MPGEPAKWFLALAPEVQELPPIVEIAHLEGVALIAELHTRASECLKGKSRSYVADAVVFAALIDAYALHPLVGASKEVESGKR